MCTTARRPSAHGRPLDRKRVSVSFALALACACMVTMNGAARAQSLDDQVMFLLGDQCAVLLQSGQAFQGGTGGPVGPNLAEICGLPPGAPSTSGGGAAAVQTSTVSTLNSDLQRRLDRSRRGQQERQGVDGASLSLDERFRMGGPGGRGFLASEASGGSASALGSRLGLFASGGAGSLDRDPTAFEDGYDSSVFNATIGLDYLFSETVAGGLVAGYVKQDGDFDLGGQHEMSSIEPTLFVSVVPSPQTFVQISAGFRSQSFDTDRLVTFASDDVDVDCGACLARSSTDADVLSGGAVFGYDRRSGAFTYGPRVGLHYNETTIDGYTETGGTGLEMIVQEQDVESLQSVVGFFGSVARSGKSAVWLPQLNVEWVHEFEDDPILLTAQFAEDLQPDPVVFDYQTNTPESDFFNVEVGVVRLSPGGIQAWANLGALVGNSTFDGLSGTFGVRFEL
jgi:uncharacterized protein YhjY with autotransporter beta-barrel domain